MLHEIPRGFPVLIKQLNLPPEIPEQLVAGQTATDLAVVNDRRVIERNSQPPAGPALPPPSEQKPAEEENPPLTLAAMLPDAVAPRRPGHIHLTTVRRVQPLPAAAWMDGPGCPDRQSDPQPVAIFADGWPRRPAPESLPSSGDVTVHSNRADRHVFQTSILRTGPPGA